MTQTTRAPKPTVRLLLDVRRLHDAFPASDVLLHDAVEFLDRHQIEGSILAAQTRIGVVLDPCLAAFEIEHRIG